MSIMSKCNKRVIEKEITLKEFKNESDGLFKWWHIEYTEENIDSPNIPRVGEYHHKEDAKRIIGARTTRDPKITVIEVVDDG